MFVIVVGQIKGGVGKTTLAVNLAGELSAQGWAVTLIDADSQQSAVQWAASLRLGFEVRQELLVSRSPELWIRNVLKSHSDFVVVDLPSGYAPLFNIAVLISDLIVIPCGPSSLDVVSARHTIAKARDVMRIDSTIRLKFVLVPTRVDISNEEGRQITEELRDLNEPVAPYLSYDPAFVRGFARGETVGSVASGSAPDLEVKSLVKYVLKRLAPGA